MSQLRTQLQVHSRYVVTPCFCCGQDNEQQFVSVLLFDGANRLGTVCPRCLVRGPQRIAADIQKHADDLIAEVGDAFDRYPDLSPPQHGWIMPAEHRAEHLLQFADRLSSTGEKWNTTIQEVIDAEKEYFRKHFETMTEDYVSRLVELRYRPFMETAAELEQIENKEQRSEIGGQESGVRSQESGVRSQGSGVRSQESAIGGQKSEVTGQKKSEVGGQKSKDRGHETKTGGHRSQDRKPK